MLACYVAGDCQLLCVKSMVQPFSVIAGIVHTQMRVIKPLLEVVMYCVRVVVGFQ